MYKILKINFYHEKKNDLDLVLLFSALLTPKLSILNFCCYSLFSVTRFDFFKHLFRKLFLLLLCYKTGVSTSFLMEIDIILDEGLLLKTIRSTSAGAKI